MPRLPPIIQAGPIELRRCRSEHLDALMVAIEISASDLALWLPWADPMPSRSAELATVQEFHAAFDADQDWAYFIFETDTDELVGGVGLHSRDGGDAEIGYWVRSDRTRRGYATAAAGALTSAAFESLSEVKSVIIRMDQANLASAAVPRRLGFRLDGEETDRAAVTAGHTGRGWIWSRSRESTRQ